MLALKCTDYTPEARPSFIQIIDMLARLEREIQDEGMLVFAQSY